MKIAPRQDRFDTLNEDLRGQLLRCAEGDRAAFGRIYELTYPKFHAIILRMVGNEDDCADILQLGYLSIWTHARRYDPERGKPFTWMLVIIRNRALDAMRAKRRKQATETLGEMVERVADDRVRSDDAARQYMIRKMLAPHISGLSDDVVRSVMMSVGGATSREIGDTLGVPTNTAKSWVRRGLKRVRLSMRAAGIDEAIEDLV